MLECSDQTIETRLQEHYNDHIFLSMLKSMRTLLALEMWLSTSLMKNYNPLRTAMKTQLSTLCKNYENLEKHYDGKSYPTN